LQFKKLVSVHQHPIFVRSGLLAEQGIEQQHDRSASLWSHQQLRTPP